VTQQDRTIDISRHGPVPRRVLVSARSIRPVLAYFSSLGHDVGRLLHDAGLDPVVLKDVESRLPHDTAIAIWDRVAAITGDSDVGLHVAEAITPGMFGAVEYVARTSPTLGAGFERLFRYHRVLHDVAETGLERVAGRAVLSHRLPLPGGAPRHVSDFVLAGWLLVGRTVTGLSWTPLEVRFPHRRPAHTAEYRRVFGAPITFEHTRSELVVSDDTLALPHVTADAALRPIVEAQASALLRSVRPDEGVADGVRRMLADELCDGDPTLERIAERLHMSARTLHRRLREQGTSFRHLVVDVRRGLAERYLREGDLAIGEIAFLLGFSEASAFHRAFKQWTGRPPLAFRQAAVHPSERQT
jgi:AraC-like DNA-binding protein